MLRTVRSAVLLVALAGVFSALPAGAQQTQQYTVSEGNTLWDLAQRFLGDPYAWREIWDANRETIPNPDLIYPGQVIRIPDGSGGFLEVRVVSEGSEEVPPPPVEEAPAQPGIQRTIFFPDTTVVAEEIARAREQRFVAVPLQSAYSAPFLPAAAGVESLGEITAYAGAEGRAERYSATPFDRIKLVLLEPMTIGTRLLAYRLEEQPEGRQDVGIPTAVLTVLGTEGVETTALVELVFDRVQLGDFLVALPEYEPRVGVRPEEVVNGASASVIAYAEERYVQAPGAHLFLDVGASNGAAIGDEFVIRASGPQSPVDGRVQLVRVDEGVSTARIVEMRSAVFGPDVELVQARRMPPR